MLLWKKLLLRYAGRETKVRTIQKLGRTKDQRAIDLLLPFLHSRYSDCAAEALGEIGDSRAVESLLPILHFNSSVAAALGKIGDARAIGPLVSQLASNWESVRTASKVSLDQINPHWRELAYDQKIFSALAVQSTSSHDSDRYAAQSAMRIIDPDWVKNGTFRAAVPILLEALQSKETNIDVRRNSALLLGAINDARAFTALVESALFDIDYHMAKDAASALHCMNPDWKNSEEVKAAIPRLVAGLQNPNSKSRSSSAQALGNIRDSQTLKPLIEALRDKDASVRCSAAEALGALRDSSAVAPLERLLADESWSVRKDAVEALERIGDARSVESLIRALQDDEARVRWAAESALKAIGASGTNAELAAVEKKIQAQRASRAARLQRPGSFMLFDTLRVTEALDALGAQDSVAWLRSNEGRYGPVTPSNWQSTEKTLESAYSCAREMENEAESGEILWTQVGDALIFESHDLDTAERRQAFNQSSLNNRRVVLKRSDGKFYRFFTWIE